MSKSKKTLAEKLLSAQVAIDNAISDVEIKTLLAVYGYDDARLAEGKALLDATNQLQQTQQKEYGDQFAATNTFNTTWDSANKDYMRFVKISRVALKKEFAIYQKLGLDGMRKESFSGWIAQAKQFYLNALSDATGINKTISFWNY